MNKYDLYPKPNTWRTIPARERFRIYLVPVDVPNPADYIHVDTFDPDSRGYGGHTLAFNLQTGEVYSVKGPWHTNSHALLKETGVNIMETHATMLTIWSTKREPYTSKGHVRHPDGSGRLVWQDVTRMIDVEDEVIYEEKQPVLGDYYRGERVAHQLANLLNKPLKYRSESYGGASEQIITPGVTKLHPNALEVFNA